MYKNLDSDGRITKDKYFAIIDELNEEPDPEKIPPGPEDFPESVQIALQIFNMLGDRVYPEIGYVGKDYTNLPIFLDLYDVEDREFTLELLAWLDSRAIKKSSDQLKKEYDKMKRKK